MQSKDAKKGVLDKNCRAVNNLEVVGTRQPVEKPHYLMPVLTSCSAPPDVTASW